MRLPPELFIAISDFADAATLRKARLASRALCELVTPSACSTLVVCLGTRTVKQRILPYLPKTMHEEHKSECQSLPCMTHMASYLRRCRIEVTDVNAHQAIDPFCIVNDFRLLAELQRLETLELAFAIHPGTGLGVNCAFGALVMYTFANIPALPFERAIVTDDTHSGLHMECCNNYRSLVFRGNCPDSLASMPRWIYLCVHQFSELQLSHMVITNDSMRGLYHMVPFLRRMSVHKCNIDMSADKVRTLLWSFLWDHARTAGEKLVSVHADGCGYCTSGRGMREFITPLEDNVALSLLLKDDANAWKSLSDTVAQRVGEGCVAPGYLGFVPHECAV